MSEEEFAEADKGKKKKKSDYAEVEFEIGNIEFEAKGRSVVVERMFRLLLEKIETGKLVAEFKLQDLEDEEEGRRKNLKRKKKNFLHLLRKPLWKLQLSLNLHLIRPQPGILLTRENQRFLKPNAKSLVLNSSLIDRNNPTVWTINLS